MWSPNRGCAAGPYNHDEPEQAGGKDRIRAENDYRVNLKSEIKKEDLHEKLDRLIANQKKIMAALHAGTGQDCEKA